MRELLASIYFDRWILHALILLPLAGTVPVLLGEERGAKRMEIGRASCRERV